LSSAFADTKKGDKDKMFGIFERFFQKDKIEEIAEFLAVAIHLDGVDERSEMEAAAEIIRKIDPDIKTVIQGLIGIKKHLMSFKNQECFLDSKERVSEYFEGHISEAEDIRAMMLIIAKADGNYSEKERLFIENIGEKTC
jgi:tellurite resistance protein